MSSPDVLREIESAITEAAPMLTKGGADSTAGQALVAGLVARYGRPAVNQAVQRMKDAQAFREIVRALR